MEMHNIFIEMLERSSLTLYRDMNFSGDKKLCIECCARKAIKRDSMVLAGVWELREIKRAGVKGSCSIC
jgi:hypothetical protein